jgi:signal recognition particle subunit SEC65
MLQNFYSSSNIISVMKLVKVRLARQVSCMEELMNQNILVWRSEGKREIVRPRSWWNCNIKIYYNEIKYDVVECIQLILDRIIFKVVTNAVMNTRYLIKRLWISDGLQAWSCLTVAVWNLMFLWTQQKYFFSSSLLPHLGACSRYWSIGLSFLSFLI